VSGLLDVIPSRVGQFSNLVTDSRRFGDWSQVFSGVDVILSGRITSGVTVQGGANIGQTTADMCDVRANLPELTVTLGPGLGGSIVSPMSPYCHAEYGRLTQFRGLGVYTIPKIGIEAGVVFQSKPGAMLAANYMASAAQIFQALGRVPSGFSNPINLLEPGSMYGDRINQLDVRLTRSWRVGRPVRLGIDFFNALNASPILSYNMGYIPGGQWLLPTSALTGRTLRITAEITF
jgi:hypothetical protein